LPAGVLIGACLCVLAVTTSLPVAFVVMALVGACGGFFVVPLNALLQETGQHSVGAGHAIAVQNLAENSVMLLMIGLYTLAVWLRMPVVGIAGVFGAGLAATIGALWLQRVRARAKPVCAAG
jgi:MFS transporter, LPLT family, lysophospholipid transporter